MSSTPKNASIEDLYRQVGSAISIWSVVEIQLYQIFTIALSLTAYQSGGGFSINATAPGAVLGSVEGFRVKLLMIDAALKDALSDLDDEATKILSEWAVESRAVEALHGHRNKLAHWRASVIRSREDGSIRKAKLEPPFWSRREGNVWQTDIDRWEHDFLDAANRLEVIVFRLAAHRGLQCKFVEQVASQILCTLPNDPTLIEYLRQQLSEHL